MQPSGPEPSGKPQDHPDHPEFDPWTPPPDTGEKSALAKAFDKFKAAVTPLPYDVGSNGVFLGGVPASIWLVLQDVSLPLVKDAFGCLSKTNWLRKACIRIVLWRPFGAQIAAWFSVQHPD
jgi:hypothetical protein